MNRLNYIYEHFLKPRTENESDRRREILLNVLFVISICIISVLYIYFICSCINEADRLKFFIIPSLIFLILLIFITAVFILSRRGSSLFSSYLIIGMYYACISGSAFCWGLDLPETILGYMLIIFISSILLGTRFCIIMTCLVCFTIIELSFFQISGKQNPLFSLEHEPFRHHIASEIIVVVLFIMCISWLSNYETSQFFKRAVISENELKKEKDTLEYKIEQRTQELKQSQIEKMTELYRAAEFGKLSSGLFHDLINPLTSVYLTISKLKEGNAANISEAKECVDLAIKASKRVENFINIIRKQIQDNKYQTLFSVQQEIHTSLNLLQYKAKESGATIHFESSAETEIFGNPLKFNQVVLNLVSNAIDAYAINNSSLNERIVHITLAQETDLILEVKDFGNGIDENVLPHIFDHFYTTKNVHGGTGIGLTTAKSIIEKDFNGKITVTSNQNITIFTVIIPAERIGKTQLF